VRPTLTPEQNEELLKRFGRLAAAKPIFPDFEKPVAWLKPELNCEVEHAGAADGPLLKEPRFKGLIESEKPDPDEDAPAAGPPAKPDASPKTPAPVPAPKPDRADPGRP
jgi:ATP-dependent DNA ligase